MGGSRPQELLLGHRALPPCGAQALVEEVQSGSSVTLAASSSEAASAKPLPTAVRLWCPPWWIEEAHRPQEDSSLHLQRKAGERGQGASLQPHRAVHIPPPTCLTPARPIRLTALP